ncbi:MAG: hypothetical protein V2A62_02540 [Candidatus Woesearchaeota archaeon]
MATLTRKIKIGIVFLIVIAIIILILLLVFSFFVLILPIAIILFFIGYFIRTLRKVGKQAPPATNHPKVASNKEVIDVEYKVK